MSPVIDMPKLIVKPPISLLEACKPLHLYLSNDARDVLKTTIQNHNIYFLCASKMKSASEFLKLL